jgi:hypothetical protein
MVVRFAGLGVAKVRGGRVGREVGEAVEVGVAVRVEEGDGLGDAVGLALGVAEAVRVTEASGVKASVIINIGAVRRRLVSAAASAGALDLPIIIPMSATPRATVKQNTPIASHSARPFDKRLTCALCIPLPPAFPPNVHTSPLSHPARAHPAHA